MRRAKIVVGVVLAAVVVVFGAIWLLLDANSYRGQVQARLEEQLQRKVTLGDMRLRLFPVRIAVEDITIAEHPNYDSPFPFTKAARLDVRVRLFPLLRGVVQVDSIDLQQPSVELIRGADGAWNFSTLGRSSSADREGDAKASTTSTDSPSVVPPTVFQSPPSAPPGDSASPASNLELNRVAIRDGQLAITDVFRNRPREIYDHIDISIHDYKPGQPFTFEVAAHIPGPERQTVEVEGVAGPLPQSGLASMPVKADVTFNEIDLSGLRQFFDSEYLPTAEGSVSGEAQVESQAGRLSAAGNLQVEGARIGVVEIGYPISFDYDLSSEVSTGILRITMATLQLGPTPLSVIGTIDTNPTPMKVSLQVRSGDASIAEVARLASAFGVAFSPTAKVAGRLSGDVTAEGPLDNLALQGTVSGRELEISGDNVPQPVRVETLDLALTPSEIRSNEFQARSGDTTVVGRFALRRYTSEKPAVDLSMRAPGATLPEIQSIASAYGLTGLEQLTGAGKLNFNLRASGPLSSVASTDVLRALNGDINLNFDTLRVQGFDAMHELARIGGFLKQDQTPQGHTSIIRLAGRVAVRNGVAQTDDLEARLNEGVLAVTGKSNLADETLDLRATAVFSKEFSERVGGTAIGGYLTTVLANSDGELVVPAIVSGSLRQPKFAPDTQAILRMQSRKLVPGIESAKSDLSKLLDSLTGKKPPEEAEKAAPEEKSASPLKGLLDGILGGKK